MSVFNQNIADMRRSICTSMFRHALNPSTHQTHMIRNKFITVIAMTCGCFAASSLDAATIPAGTTLAVQTVSSISSNDPVGRTFAAQLDQDVTVKGNVLLKTGTKVFGRIKSSRANPRRSEPLTLELTSISVIDHGIIARVTGVRQADEAGTEMKAPDSPSQVRPVNPSPSAW
jgi:hypothetical protein